MMKLSITLLIVACLYAGSVLSQPSQIYVASSNNLITYNFNTVSLSNGAFVNKGQFPGEVGDIYGILNVTDSGFLIVGKNTTAINMFSYDIASNETTFISYVDINWYQFSIQPLGFDQNSGIVYLAGGNTMDSNVTIFSWDFIDHEFDYIELPYLYDPNNIQAEGAYDPVSGNFAIAYLDDNDDIHVATYNIPAEFVVSDNIIPQFKRGSGLTSYVELFYANGQLYAVVFTPLSDVELYTVSVKNGAVNLVFSTKSTYYFYDASFVNNDEYVVFITSVADGTVTYTTVDLSTYTQVSKTGNVTPIQYGYSLLLSQN